MENCLHDETSGPQAVGMLLENKHDFAKQCHASKRLGVFGFDAVWLN